jgi:hypothetical protein
LQTELDGAKDPNLRVFVIWEPVLSSDWGPPNGSALARMGDRRVVQFWDRPRALSEAIRAAGDQPGRLKGNIVWDYVAVFAPGVRWEQQYPFPAFAGAPVLDIIDRARPYLR